MDLVLNNLQRLICLLTQPNDEPSVMVDLATTKGIFQQSLTLIIGASLSRWSVVISLHMDGDDSTFWRLVPVKGKNELIKHRYIIHTFYIFKVSKNFVVKRKKKFQSLFL